jgi:hypothetical protein
MDCCGCVRREEGGEDMDGLQNVFPVGGVSVLDSARDLQGGPQERGVEGNDELPPVLQEHLHVPGLRPLDPIVPDRIFTPLPRSFRRNGTVGYYVILLLEEGAVRSGELAGRAEVAEVEEADVSSVRLAFSLVPRLALPVNHCSLSPAC